MSDRESNINAESIVLLRCIVSVGLLTGLLLSYKTWLTSPRLYPCIPVIPTLPDIPFPVDYFFFGATLLLCMFCIFSNRPRIYSVLLTANIAFLCLFDLTRWQPWVFQYLFLLIVICSYKYDGNSDKEAAIINSCRFVIASSYFFGGLHKLNPTYLDETFRWFISPLVPNLQNGEWLALLSALIEMLLAVALLVPQTRKRAAWVAVLLHAFILYCLGPFGHNWNFIVWPWNIVLALLVLVLFVRAENIKFKRFFQDKVISTATTVFFFLLPTLSLFGFWESNLSSNLYSGNVDFGILILRPDELEKLPVVASKFATREKDGNYSIRIAFWAMDELNVPAYPSDFASISFARRTAAKFGIEHLKLRINRRTTLLQEEPQVTVFPEAL